MLEVDGMLFSMLNSPVLLGHMFGFLECGESQG